MCKILWVRAVDNFKMFLRVTQPRGSFFVAPPPKTFAAPEITFTIVTWNWVTESAAHFQLGFWVLLPLLLEFVLDLECIYRHFKLLLKDQKM